MEKVRLSESGQGEMADCRERGANATPVRGYFSFFFFSFPCPPSARCSGFRFGQVGVGEGPQNTSTALYTSSLALLTWLLRPSVHQTAVSHAVRCTVTWTGGPDITNPFVGQSSTVCFPLLLPPGQRTCLQVSIIHTSAFAPKCRRFSFSSSVVGQPS